MGTYTTASELRTLGLETSLDDAALEKVIAGIEDEIHSRYGTLLARTVRLDVPERSAFLVLPTKVASIANVVETLSSTILGASTQTLEASDYLLVDTRRVLRLATGAHPSGAWSPWGVSLEITPLASAAVRRLVVLDVAKVDLANKGLASFRAGEYSETAASGQGGSAEERRDAIFRRLARTMVFA